MCDPPMTAIERGIRYVMISNDELQSNNLRPQCWKCRGSGRLIVKESSKQNADCSSTDDKGMLKYYKTCRICVHEMNEPEPAHTNGRISVFKNYAQTGPTTPGNVADKHFQPKLGETLCSLSGHYMIYQYTKGHRFTTDDVCTAYFAYTETKHPIMGRDDRDSAAADKSPSRRSHLDLGCGLGSVLLMLKWKYGEEIYRTVGVEAQHANLALARRSIVFNGLQVIIERIERNLFMIDSNYR